MLIKKLSKYFFSKDQILLVIGLALFLGAGVLNLKIEKPIIKLSKQDTALNINKNLLIFSSAGNKRLITDLLWIQTLIESDLERYGNRDLNNWLFLRFSTISVLDRRFYENYLFGGQFLSIVKDDLEGASFIYEKGLKEYPDDYRLNFQAGFLNYWELDNPEKGLKYLTKVKDHPKAPHFIHSIINKLKIETGIDLETIYKLVLHSYESTLDEQLRYKLRGDLYSIKAELDLTCLNEKKSNCSLEDFDGNKYIYKDGKYHSPKTFLIYRINKRGKTESPLPRSKIDTIQ